MALVPAARRLPIIHIFFRGGCFPVPFFSSASDEDVAVPFSSSASDEYKEIDEEWSDKQLAASIGMKNMAKEEHEKMVEKMRNDEVDEILKEFKQEILKMRKTS